MRLKKVLLVSICGFMMGCSNLQPTKKVDSSVTEQKKTTDITKEKNKITPQEALKNFENSPILKGSNWSFYAIDLDKNKVIANYQENKAVIPASVYKLITSITALEVIGKDTELETKLRYSGNIENGVLKGDLIIVGGGDPTLGSEFLKDKKYEFLEIWSDTLRNMGIKSIEGDILVKDNLFGYEGVSNKWQLEDLGSNYGQGVYGISIFDNIYDITLNTTKAEVKPKIVSIKPKINNLSIINNAIVDKNYKINDFVVRGLPFENQRELRGVFAKSSKPVKIQSDIPNPGLFLGEYFKDYLKKKEIVVKGEVITSRIKNISLKNTQLVSTIKSPSIENIVEWLLYKSDNHYTESLNKHIRVVKKINPYSYWKNKGFDVEALTTIDGCGLSRSNTVSTKFLVELLKYADKNIKPLLPTAGVNGNVARFLKDTELKGKVFLKTGSMSRIQSYTGFIEKDGNRYAFSIIINHWNGSRMSLNKEIEKLFVNTF